MNQHTQSPLLYIIKNTFLHYLMEELLPPERRPGPLAVVGHFQLPHVHREHGGEEEGLQEVVGEEPHDGEQAKLVDKGVHEPDEEAGRQDGYLSHLNLVKFRQKLPFFQNPNTYQIHGNIPAFPTEALRHADLDIKM